MICYPIVSLVSRRAMGVRILNCYKLMTFCNHLNKYIKLFFRTLLKKPSVKYTGRLKVIYVITIGGYEKQIDAIKDAAFIEQILDKGYEIQIESIIVKKE